MYKAVLVPVDNSKLSMQALGEAKSLCEKLGARLTVATVSPAYPMVIAGDGYIVEPISPKQWKESVAAHHKAIAADVDKKLKGFAHTLASVTADYIHEGILFAAKKHKCDLIVMASHGRRGIGALLLGSETTKVLTHTKLPVLVVR
ncbi:MAG: universal stress protein [Burkholderiales bacterium]